MLNMLEECMLLSSPREKIVVQTREGTDLENFIAPIPCTQSRNFYQVLVDKYGKQWLPRKGPTGIYNCAGLIWASRRTALPEPKDWERILKEDGYREVPTDEKPSIGDVAIYRDLESKEVIHVARLCGFKEMLVASESTIEIPWVLSKWDAKFGECYHAIKDVFLNGGVEFSVNFVTDRE